MDCESLLKATLDDVQVSNTNLLERCPSICNHVHGRTDFALAGPGVYTSLLIQIVLFSTLGTSLSLISSIPSVHASPLTRSLCSRLRILWDSAYDMGIFIYLTTIITIYLRLRTQTDQILGTYEYDVMATQMSLYLILASEGCTAYNDYKAPMKSSPSKRSIRGGRNALGVLIGAMLFARRSGRTVGLQDHIPKTAAFHICSVEIPRYEAEWRILRWIYTPFFNRWSICVFCLVVLAPAILSQSFRRAMPRIIFSRPVQRSMRAMNIGISFGRLVWCCYLLASLRKQKAQHSHLVNPSWDLAQVMVVLLWLPVIYRIVSVLLMSIDAYFAPRHPNDENSIVLMVLRAALWAICDHSAKGVRSDDNDDGSLDDYSGKDIETVVKEMSDLTASLEKMTELFGERSAPLSNLQAPDALEEPATVEPTA